MKNGIVSLIIIVLFLLLAGIVSANLVATFTQDGQTTKLVDNNIPATSDWISDTNHVGELIDQGTNRDYKTDVIGLSLDDWNKLWNDLMNMKSATDLTNYQPGMSPGSQIQIDLRSIIGS